MNVKGFFVASLSSALDLGIATPDDVLRHVTPDVLATHLPRPLWARLLTASLGAPKVDSQLVVETIGVPNLCEHVPSPIIWACLAEIAHRSLSGVPALPIPRPAAMTPPAGVAAASKSAPLPLATPPPEIKRDTPPRGTPLPSVMGHSIPKPGDPAADGAAHDSDDRGPLSPGGRSRTPTGQRERFRQSSTGIGRLAQNNARRPQAQTSPTAIDAAPVPPASAAAAAAAAAKPPRRGQTEADAYDVDTELKDDWKNALAVEDEQLVDWTASEETMTSADEFSKRKH